MVRLVVELCGVAASLRVVALPSSVPCQIFALGSNSPRMFQIILVVFLMLRLEVLIRRAIASLSTWQLHHPEW